MRHGRVGCGGVGEARWDGSRCRHRLWREVDQCGIFCESAIRAVTAAEDKHPSVKRYHRVEGTLRCSKATQLRLAPAARERVEDMEVVKQDAPKDEMEQEM